MVRVEVQGGGEGPDVSDERGVPERRRAGWQEGQLTHLPVGGTADGALLHRVVLLPATPDHLTHRRDALIRA